MSFLYKGEPPPPISTPWGGIQATRLPLGAVNLFGMHIIPPFAITARYQFYTLVRVRHMWSSYLAQGCYSTAGPSHVSHYGAILAGQSPIHVLTGLHDCLTSVIKCKMFAPCYVSPHVTARYEYVFIYKNISPVLNVFSRIPNT